MGELEVLQLHPHSPDLKGTLSEFLVRNLEAGFIGPQNAERLMPLLPYREDPQLRRIERRLAGVEEKDLKLGHEVVAAALRQPDDFQRCERVHTRATAVGATWDRGIVESTDDHHVTIRINDLLKFGLRAYYPALFNDPDNELLHRQHAHQGILSPAFFAIKLSCFDPRLANWPELIEKTVRHYRPQPIRS